LDKWILDDLRKKKVDIVVIEKISWSGTIRTLLDFPQLALYLRENFKLVRQIGIFYVLEKR